MDPVMISLILSTVIPILTQVIGSLSFLQENRDPTQAELDDLISRLNQSTEAANTLRDHLLSLKAIE